MRKELNVDGISDFKALMKILFEDMFMWDNINLIAPYEFSEIFSERIISLIKEKHTIQNELYDEVEKSVLMIVDEYFNKIKKHIEKQDFVFSNSVTNYKKNMPVLLRTLQYTFPHKYELIILMAISTFHKYTLENAEYEGLLDIKKAKALLDKSKKVKPDDNTIKNNIPVELSIKKSKKESYEDEYSDDKVNQQGLNEMDEDEPDWRWNVD